MDSKDYYKPVASYLQDAAGHTRIVHYSNLSNSEWTDPDVAQS